MSVPELAVPAALGVEQAADRVARAWRALGYRVIRDPSLPGHVYADRYRHARLATYVNHLGLIMMLWGWDPKETAALTTWLIYAGYLHAHWLKSWRGTRSSVLVLLGFAATLFTYYGNLFLGGLHAYSGL